MNELKKAIQAAKVDRWVKGILFWAATLLTPLSWVDVIVDPKNYWNWFFALYFTFLLLRLNKSTK